jgi:SurA N-terminal domain/PPIC-type PPIASE domain
MNLVYFEGAATKVRKSSRFFVSLAVMAIASFLFMTSGCDSTGTGSGGKGDVAATVNGRPITKEQVEKMLKQQGQGQESKLSPLELAQARLTILETLIQQEVMFQKAEKENTVPKDEDVAAEFNKQKTSSGLSAEQFDKKMQELGQTEATAKDSIKKGLAIQKLMEKITSKVDAPKDSEIEEFYSTNKDMFVKKRGVKLAAIVVDPASAGAGDTTTDEATARLKVSDLATKLNTQGAAAFADLARDNSEDPSRVNGGELEYMPEETLKQSFGQYADGFMNEKFAVGQVAGPLQLFGKYYFFKLLERNMSEETLTLEKPGTREQINGMLVQVRKNLLQASYTAIAMNEAKVDNLLARQVVDHPNELSGARPASAQDATTPPPIAAPNAANTEPKKDTGNANNAKPPAAASPAKLAAKPAANTPGNK